MSNFAPESQLNPQEPMLDQLAAYFDNTHQLRFSFDRILGWFGITASIGIIPNRHRINDVDISQHSLSSGDVYGINRESRVLLTRVYSDDPSLDYPHLSVLKTEILKTEDPPIGRAEIFSLRGNGVCSIKKIAVPSFDLENDPRGLQQFPFAILNHGVDIARLRVNDFGVFKMDAEATVFDCSRSQLYEMNSSVNSMRGIIGGLDSTSLDFPNRLI